MPLYGVAQSGNYGPPNQGKNLTSLIVGEQITLFDGAETPLTGVKSVAFANGYNPQGGNSNITFNASGMPSDMTIDVQVAAHDIEAEYSSIGTLAASAGTPDTGNGFLTDDGKSAFYRLYITNYTTGAMPIVTATK
jgi:hypothetical protein